MKKLIVKMTSFDPSDRQKIKDVLALFKNAEVCSGMSTYFWALWRFEKSKKAMFLF